MGLVSFKEAVTKLRRTNLLGMVTTRKSVKMSFFGSIAIGLILGLFVWSGNGHAQGSLQITGTVTDPSGNSLQNVSVYATDPGTSTVDYGPVTTSTDGTYELDVNPGTYDFHFVSPSGSGYNAVLESSVTISENQVINIQFASSYTYSGTLTDSAGNPISGVNIALSASDGNTSSAVTDANGNFSMSAKPDMYSLLIYNGNTIDSNLSQYELLQKGTPSINLTNGNVSQNLQINTATIHVTVLDANGNPLPNVDVTASSSSTNPGAVYLYPNDPGTSIVAAVNGELGAPLTTDSNGNVNLTSIVGANYGTVYNTPGSICADISGSQVCLAAPLTVSGNTNVTIQEPSSYTYSGTLTDSAGNPISGVNIALSASDGNTSSAVTDANGNFSMSAKPDMYSLLIYNGNTIDSNLSQYELLQKGTPSINLTNGNVSQNLQINTATIHVTVLDANGNPLPNVDVTASSSSTNPGAVYLYPNDPGTSIVAAVNRELGAPLTTDSNGNVNLTSIVGANYGTVYNTPGSICADISGNEVCNTSPVTVTGATNVVIQEVNPNPSTPTNLTAPSPTNLYPSLSWSTTSGATSYNIYRNGSLIGNTPSTTYTDSSLTTTTPGSTDGTYSYTVTAVNSSGESTQSSPITVVYDTTPPVVTITGVVSGETYAANNTPIPVCNTTDSLSGVATNATVSVSNSGNSYTATCSGASDNAGNIAPSVSDTYTVLPSNYTLVNLTNSSSSYLSGAKVTIENSASQVTTLSTDSFGNTYLNTTPGTYKVTVYYANGYESQNITVTANGPNNINFTTVPVTVTINDPNTTDLANATVAQAGNTGTFGTKQPVNSNGQITFQVLPGTNYFTAYVANGYQEQSITATTGTNTVTYNTDSVQVTVTKNGSPLPTATVDQAGNSGTYGSKQHVNSNGQYTFYVLPGTNYFEAFDGSNSAKQTLNVTANTTTTIGVE